MEDVKLDFDDVMIVPQETDVTSRSQVALGYDIRGRWGATITGVPIIAANMVGVGNFSMARALSKFGMFTAITKDVPVKEWHDFFENRENHSPWWYTNGQSALRMSPVDSVFLTLGMDNLITENEGIPRSNIKKLKMLAASGCFKQMKIIIDVANGYMRPFYDYIKEVRDIVPDAFILAGTVCTPEAAEKIVESGADMARVGIGTGAVCTTRQVAGVGYPQASAIKECSEVAYVVCDGGCRIPADFSKAFGLGADMIMAGSVFAAHEEGGIAPDEDGNVLFFGMSSHAAQDLYGKRNEYRASEGRVVKIPFRGTVNDTALHILGGIRSACAYSNCKFLDELHVKAKFIRVNNQLNRSLEKYTI